MTLPVSITGKHPLEVARLCAAEARRIICDGYGRVGVSGVKGRGNVVTETDLAVEVAVTAILRTECPDHAIMSEETAAAVRSEGWMWVVDPLDGTKNFSRGIPHFAFTMALCHAGVPQVGLTIHPLIDEEYAAVLGSGFTFNGKRTTVIDCGRVADAVVAIDLGYNDSAGRRQLDLASGLFPGLQSLRISGSAALGGAFVAAGKWDVYLHADLEPWDTAAGLLLVREAGGIVSNHRGEPATIYDRDIVAAAPAVHADFWRRAQALGWAADRPDDP